MNVNRRNFTLGIIGSGLVALTTTIKKPAHETVVERIQRLFANCSIQQTPEACEALAPSTENHTFILVKPDEELLKLSDYSFIKVIESNIREDFTEKRTVDLAGWRLSNTEIAIMGMLAHGGR